MFRAFIESLQGPRNLGQEEIPTGEFSGVSVWGNRFPVKVFENPEGFSYDGQKAACGFCGQLATIKHQIYNHLHEPQGSSYYCDNHEPPQHAYISE